MNIGRFPPMPRLIIAIGLLFGFVAAGSSADTLEELEDRADDRFREQIDDRLSSIASEALEMQIGSLSARLAQRGNHLASMSPGAVRVASEAAGIPGAGSSTSSTTARPGRMHCWVSSDRVLQCRVVPEPAVTSELIADPGGPAAPAVER
jgi:hypothetical protein